MDTKQLTTFITLAKTLNYQKAAAQLQYAPSTLFKHIQMLEQELGVELLHKQGRQLQLTAEGQAFEEHAENILDSYRKAIHSICASHVHDSSLNIGGCEVNTGNSLLRLFAQFTQAYPQARMSMTTSPNMNVPSLVKNDLIDMGFYYSLDGKKLPGMETEPLYMEPVYLLAGKENPIFDREKIAYADLAGMPFVYPHDTCCFVSELLILLRRKGISLGKVTYLGNVHLVVEHVHTENAMTLMPRCAVERFCKAHDMRVIELGDPQIWAWNTLVYKNYESLRPLARELLEHTKQYAQRMLSEDDMLRSDI